MKLSKITFIVLPAFVLGAIAGYVGKPGVENAGTVPIQSTRTEKRSDDAALGKLRDRIRDLERKLAEKKAGTVPAGDLGTVPVKTHTGTVPVEKISSTPPVARRTGNWLNDLKTSDPQRYATIINRMAVHRAEQLERAQGKLDILDSVDLSLFTPEQRETHERYKDCIAKMEELREMFNPSSHAELSEEDRNKWRGELRSTMEELFDLASKERDALLSYTANTFGFKDETAADFVETIKAVYQATEAFGGRNGNSRRNNRNR